VVLLGKWKFKNFCRKKYWRLRTISQESSQFQATSHCKFSRDHKTSSTGFEGTHIATEEYCHALYTLGGFCFLTIIHDRHNGQEVSDGIQHQKSIKEALEEQY
jgi:hypothetical protein